QLLHLGSIFLYHKPFKEKRKLLTELNANWHLTTIRCRLIVIRLLFRQQNRSRKRTKLKLMSSYKKKFPSVLSRLVYRMRSLLSDYKRMELQRSEQQRQLKKLKSLKKKDWIQWFYKAVRPVAIAVHLLKRLLLRLGSWLCWLKHKRWYPFQFLPLEG